MTRWQRWWQRRGSEVGISSGVGVIAGMILFVTVLTAGIGAVQAVRAHHALYQAAQKASQVEQQQGCWTAAASSAVYNTLRQAGINPNTVQVTAGTPTSHAYGHGVTAGLKTHIGITVLGLKLLSVPMAAAANATSFYTPSTAGAINPACVPVSVCPVITQSTPQCTPAHQTCQTMSHQQCTPVSQQVCHTVPTQQCTPVTTQQCGYTTQDVYACHAVTTQQCGDTTQEVYACHPVTSCHPVTHRTCRTTPGRCYTFSVNGSPRRYCYPPTTSCTTSTTPSCSTTQQCGYTPQSVYACHPVTTQQCGYTPQSVYGCHPVTTQQCTTVNTQQCQTVTTQSCHAVQTQQCQTVPQQCTTLTQQVNPCTGAVVP